MLVVLSHPARQQLFDFDSEFLRDFSALDTGLRGVAPGQHASVFLTF